MQVRVGSQSQPSTPSPAVPPGQEISCSGLAGESAQNLYRAAVNGRSELRNQLNTLTSERLSIAQRLRVGNATGPDKAGLEARITQLDAQIVALDAKLATADADVARAASVPCVSADSRGIPNISNRDKEYALTALFFIVVLFPISIGLARRLWRRGAAAVANIPRDLSDRLSRLEQALESVAIEVERIGEGQRFMTNVLVDSVSERALGAGTMEAVPAKSREHAEPLRRD